MADNFQEDENYLPDLNNELAGEQIVLQQEFLEQTRLLLKSMKKLLLGSIHHLNTEHILNII